MEIYLIRHTKPDIAEDVCYGQADAQTSHDFEPSLRFILRNIPDLLDAVYMSPSGRCTQLGERIKAGRPVKDSRLMELNFGEWELKRWEEINPDILRMWMEDFVNYVVPGGESFKQLFMRVGSFIEYLKHELFRQVAIVTHAGVIRCFVAHFLGVPLENAFRISVDYGSITKIEIEGSSSFPKLVFLNKSAQRFTG